jgi:DNA-binding transcriptional MerR regulator
VDIYTTSNVATLFDVTQQTVKNWAREFAQYLSPTATPQEGKKRFFTVDDLEVFSLVHEYHKQRLSYEDAHLTLKTGQRGIVPDKANELSPATPPHILSQLRDEIVARDQIIKTLQTERDMALGKVHLLQDQLEQKEKLIRDLYQENARFKAQDEKD